MRGQGLENSWSPTSISKNRLTENVIVVICKRVLPYKGIQFFFMSLVDKWEDILQRRRFRMGSSKTC